MLLEFLLTPVTLWFDNVKFSIPISPSLMKVDEPCNLLRLHYWGSVQPLAKVLYRSLMHTALKTVCNPDKSHGSQMFRGESLVFTFAQEVIDFKIIGNDVNPSDTPWWNLCLSEWIPEKYWDCYWCLLFLINSLSLKGFHSCSLILSRFQNFGLLVSLNLKCGVC